MTFFLEHGKAVIATALLLAGLITGAWAWIESHFGGVYAEIAATRNEMVQLRASIDNQSRAELHRADREKERDELWIELDKDQTERLNDTLESVRQQLGVLSQLVGGLYERPVALRNPERHPE